MTIKNLLLLPTAATFLLNGLLGCGSSDSEPQSLSKISRMSEEERLAYAPSPLFTAVFEGNLDQIRDLIETDSSSISTKNVEGKTALMVALEEQGPSWYEISLELANNSGLESLRLISDIETIHDEIALDRDHSDLTPATFDQRSVVSYAAEAGHLEVIRRIRNAYEDNIPKKLLNTHWYLFSHMDQQDQWGRRALFYAKNAATADELLKAWTAGRRSKELLSFTLLDRFFRGRDQYGQNFIHRAVVDNRKDTVKWALQRLCAPPLWNGGDDDKGFIGQIFGVVGGAVSWVGDILQTVPVEWISELVNQKDKEGNTPLHLAAFRGLLETSQSLISCRKVSLGAENDLGLNSLSYFLTGIDSKQAEASSESKSLLKVFLKARTQMWPARWLYRPEDYVNNEDHHGNTALHHAARILDPYFYDQMKAMGDITQTNHAGETPELLRKRTASGDNN